MKTVAIGYRDQKFHDRVVYIGGHSYERCEFHRCTVVFTSGFSQIEKCKFVDCVWHINFFVHDPDIWDAFVTTTANLITASLVRKAP